MVSPWCDGSVLRVERVGFTQTMFMDLVLNPGALSL